ncbi:MAG: hypothetical protein V1800_01015 [Candidatus Latescibacterota bacterium]
MTHKERMMSTLAGCSADRMPWAPRLDLWYTANKRAGTLPARYRHAPLSQITDDQDCGFHAIVPAFKDLRDPSDEVHRALGIFNLWTMPYATELENVEVSVTTEGDQTHVVYRTPVGALTTTVIYDESMRRAGVSITHVSEHAIKDRRDYAAVEYLFEHARVLPNYMGYDEFCDGVGDRGIAAAFLSLAGSPMHLLQRELMPMSLFFYELYDHPEELAHCADAIGGYFDRMFEVVSQSSAEVFLLGANYDATVTYPPFFREHIKPWLKRFSGMLHAKGKFLLTHTDGENTGLLEEYLDSEIDIADSVCPSPMTKLTLKEVRDCFGGKVTIMGGIPAVCLLKSSMSDRDFEAYLDRFFSELDAGDHLILGVSDTTPPAAEFDRIERIGQRVREFGPIGCMT